jgi:hypothetical protein
MNRVYPVMKPMKLLVPIALAVVLFSCQKKTTHENIRANLAYNQIRDNFFNNLIEPDTAAVLLARSVISFNEKLLSNPADAAVYSADGVKAAANLGIYLADLNYCIVFQQQHTASAYFEAAVELSTVIGLEKQLLAFLMKRYRDSGTVNDSLQAVFNALFDQTTHALHGKVNERLAGIVMAGYHIENLYLVTGLMRTQPRSDTLFSFTRNQQQSIEATFEFLKAVSDPLNPAQNPNYPYYASAFDELLGVYKEIATGALPYTESVEALHRKVASIRTRIME